jgi:hypothetical protein
MTGSFDAATLSSGFSYLTVNVTAASNVNSSTTRIMVVKEGLYLFLLSRTSGSVSTIQVGRYKSGTASIEIIEQKVNNMFSAITIGLYLSANDSVYVVAAGNSGNTVNQIDFTIVRLT